MTSTSLLKLTASVFLLLSVLSISALAQVTTLASFDEANGRDPGFPAAAFVQGTNGYLYGTTVAGGANDEGTIFRMSSTGILTTLYSFCSQPGCSDGAVANAGLIQGTDGNFYGTTGLGGTNNLGTIFKITPAGGLTTIYRFCVELGCQGGTNPEAGLLQASDGNFYGTTANGGAYGLGTVFKMTKAGVVTTVVSFNGANGMNPLFGSLIQGTDGSLYGTTGNGGANTGCGSSTGCGTAFRVTLQGSLTTLYSFCAQLNCADGASPFGGLVQGIDGTLFGTATEGGIGYGTAFRITGPGKLTVLHSFNFTDGAYPEAGLLYANDDNFYGTTSEGGENGLGGTLFQITPRGDLTTLYNFCSKANCADGNGAFSGLLEATTGTLYGATFAGGTSSNCIGGCGTAFSLSVGLGPFVETRLTSGRPGARVIVLGSGLTGTSAVNFDGIPAVFTVVSATETVATVPIGAANGFVTLSTPTGTIRSNVPFRVLP